MQIRTRIATTAVAAITALTAVSSINLSRANADDGNGDARCATLGYYMVARDGGVFTKGAATYFGSVVGEVSSPVVGIAPTSTQQGYWLAMANGEVRGKGDARALGNVPAGNTIVSMAGSYNSGGYWVVNDRGNVFAFGNAPYLGGAVEGKRVVGIVAHPTAMGYWIVTADGAVRAFGAARTHLGSGAKADMSHQRLTSPIVGMSASGDGNGYWLVGADGGIFSFGNAPFFGSTGQTRLNQPVVGMTSLPNNQGYYFVAADGGLFTFGADVGAGRIATPYCGSMGDTKLNQPIVGMVLQQAVSGSTGRPTAPPVTAPPVTVPPVTVPPVTVPPVTVPPVAPPKTAAELCVDSKLAALQSQGYEPGSPLRPLFDWQGGKTQHFANRVTVFHHTTYGCREIHGDIQAKYNQVQAGGMNLGYPTNDITASAGGLLVNFQDGGLYWKNNSIGVRVVHGYIYVKYKAMGGPSSALGFPTSDESSTSCIVGWFNAFEKGWIISYSGRTYFVTGMIGSDYGMWGGTCSSLGAPTDDTKTMSTMGSGTSMQYFTKTAVYNNGLDSFIVRGQIFASWTESMATSEWWLGYPTDNEVQINGMWSQQFQAGGIYINEGNHFVKGNTNKWYLYNGGMRYSYLGAPTSSTHLIGGGTANPFYRTYFQNGRIEFYYSGPNSGKTCHLYSNGAIAYCQS